MTTSIYEQLESRVLPLLKAYHRDLIVHDRAAMEKYPGVPFLHWTRECGTHITHLIPLELYPPAGVRVPYLFGHADRQHILDEIVRFAQHFVKPLETPHICHHYDGTKLRQITNEQAVEIAREYYERIDREWRKSRYRVA